MAPSLLNVGGRFLPWPSPPDGFKARNCLNKEHPVKRHYLFFAAFVLMVPLVSVGSAFGQISDDSSEFTPLNNKDILVLVERRVETDEIVKTIKSSACTFDTFPPVLREMKRRGVPESVLQAMVEAPYGPSIKSSSKDDLGEQPIYHYAEQLKQMGFLTPLGSGRGLQSSRQRGARASRPRQQFR